MASLQTTTVTGDLTVNGGDIVLGGTGRIQGIDTVSSSTDAANKLYVDTSIGSATPTATVILRPVNNLPAGFLECNGALLSRTTYSDLFAILGTTYGAGDGSTTFNIPDLRGEFIRGWDNGRGVDAGRNIGSSQADLLKSHNHTIRGGDYFAARAGYDGSIDWYSARANYFDANYYGMDISGGGAETRPRNIAMMYCIKY